MANSHIILDDSIKDCGTKQYFKLKVDKSIAGTIKDRYYQLNGRPKLIDNPAELIGQTINMRSPLYCKSEKGICPICYGKSWELLKTKNIGILVGGNINDKALNAYMKMRHKSSVPKMVEVNFINDLEKYNINDAVFNKHFIVSEKKIISNCNCFVELDLNDYDETLIVESVDYYLVPGIFTITLTEDNTKSWTFPFEFQVKLYKPADFQIRGKLLTFNFVPGETIISQEMYPQTADVTVLEKLLEGQAKFINKPELLVFALSSYLDGLDLNLIEILVQNMFRDAEDPGKPARLTDYNNYVIYGQKKLPFVTSWINALSFENVKKAIQYGLVSGQDAVDDPITKIVNEKYN